MARSGALRGEAWLRKQVEKPDSDSAVSPKHLDGGGKSKREGVGTAAQSIKEATDWVPILISLKVCFDLAVFLRVQILHMLQL